MCGREQADAKRLQMADPGLGGMTRKQIPAQFQEELSNNLSCLTTCLLAKDGAAGP